MNIKNDNVNFRSVDVINANNISREEFNNSFVKPGIPCIFEGLFDDSAASSKWSRQYFCKELGNLDICFHYKSKLDAGIDWNHKKGKTRLKEFIARLDSGEGIKHFPIAHPLYDFVSSHPQLRKEVDLSRLKSLLPASRFMGLGRTNFGFWPWIPPFPHQMFISGGESISPGHYDPDFSHTFHWCLWGRKSVILIPYEQRLSALLQFIRNVDISRPENHHHLARLPEIHNMPVWSTNILPGQTVFVPSRMWHFFKYQQTSASYVVRVRSFDSLSGYLDFSRDQQSPLNTIPYYAQLWREVTPRYRGFHGNLVSQLEKPVLWVTRILIKVLEIFAGKK